MTCDQPLGLAAQTCPATNIRLVSPNQPSTITVTSMFRISPSFRTLGPGNAMAHDMVHADAACMLIAAIADRGRGRADLFDHPANAVINRLRGRRTWCGPFRRYVSRMRSGQRPPPGACRGNLQGLWMRMPSLVRRPLKSVQTRDPFWAEALIYVMPSRCISSNAVSRQLRFEASRPQSPRLR